MMLLLEQSDSGWMTHTDIQDNKQILSLLWVNWVIYLYHVLLFPDFFSFNRSHLRSDVPLILVQSLFSLSPSRLWAFCQYIQISDHLIHCNFIQYHACCRASFFGRVNKALEIFHYPTRGYSTTRLLSSLPYPTLPETEKPVPVRACS